MEDQAAAVVAVPQAGGGLEQAHRRPGLVVIELGVALVGGDDEIEFLGQFDQPLQGRQGDHRPAGVAGGTEVEQLAAPPGVGRHRREIREITLLREAGQVARLGPGQEGRPLVDLIEGVGHQHQGLA